MDYIQSSIDFLVTEIQDHPIHIVIELIALVFILYLIPQRPYKPRSKPDELTEQEIDTLCKEWEPAPLYPAPTERVELDEKVPIVTSANGAECIMDGKSVINLGSFNFLGLSVDKDVQNACEETILKYGVGACGPRGFYGTIDVHLELENRIAQFMGTKESIVYSYGFATIASAIPAFSKRGDIIVCDEGVNFSVQTGVNLSRSIIKYFKHNDVEDLERILKSIQDDFVKSGKKVEKRRRFIVIEGLYQNFGDIAPLHKIIELKKKYYFRLIMDDSFGVGVLGKTGRGTCEHYGISPKEVDILTSALGNSFASEGGFCIGEEAVVDHQRLSGAGYCFSASLPPFLARASIEAINKIDSKPELLEKLSKNAQIFYEEFVNPANGLDSRVVVDSAPFSPIFHLRLANRSHKKAENPEKVRLENDKILQKIVDKAFEEGLGLTRSKYGIHEKFMPESSIRITVSALHSETMLRQAAATIKRIIPTVLDQYY